MTTQPKTIGLIHFVLGNFGPIVAFYVANHFYGLTAAVAASIIWTVGEIVVCLRKKKPISLFFLFSAALAITFGLIDLYLQKSLFFKYEAALTNALVGVYFFATLFGQKSLIQEFAQAQGRVAGELSPDTIYYFKFLTLIWSLYSFTKAIFYLWVAANYSLEEGLAMRGVVGNMTFYALLGISIFGAKAIKTILGQFKLLPSTKIAGRL